MLNVARSFLLFILLVSLNNTWAKPTKNIIGTEKQLKVVNAQIEQIQKKIHQKETHHQKLLTEIKKTELAINKIEALNRKTKLTIDQQKRILERLQQQKQQQKQVLSSQQLLLARHLQAYYRMGQPAYLKLLLNQENIANTNRLLTYHTYLNRYRLVLIHQIKSSIQTLAQQQEAIQQQMATLTSLQETQEHQHQSLAEHQIYDQKLTTRLQHEIENQNKTLSQLQQDRQNLNSVISKLKHQAYWQQSSLSFSKMQHQLPWPTKGKILQHFGQPLKDAQLTSNGVFIAARAGQEVQAIFPGKIVFADWLRGFGLLIIIDHQHGYLSLYAHNHSLYKKVNDQVLAGDLIANVGHSGGNAKDGLYFEIRHQENPLNPEQWCTRKM